MVVVVAVVILEVEMSVTVVVELAVGAVFDAVAEAAGVAAGQQLQLPQWQRPEKTALPEVEKRQLGLPEVGGFVGSAASAPVATVPDFVEKAVPVHLLATDRVAGTQIVACSGDYAAEVAAGAAVSPEHSTVKGLQVVNSLEFFQLVVAVQAQLA